MSKYIQVNQALAAIEQGRFQILCNDFLKNEYPGDLQSIGTVEGKEKSRSGQPDAYIRKPDGQYILGEFTTKDDAFKSAFETKLRDDLDECLKFESLGIKPHQVDQIVLCCNSVVDIAFGETLNEIVSPLGIRLRIIGIETLSTYYSSTGKLFARDFLNIKFDTGQVLDKNSFIERYNKKDLSTPLTNVLLGRELELKNLLSMIGERSITLLLGGAGSGKTRLALQAMDDFVEANPEFIPYYIFGKSGDIIEDLLTFLHPGKAYILLVDDANRQVDNLLSVLDRMLDKGLQVKIVITVRDYAKDDVLKHIRKLDFEFFALAKLSDDIIQQVIYGPPFSIGDWTARKRISDIAEGNPRLAIMAARVYRQNPVLQSISDVSVIYDEYFQSIMDDGYLRQNEFSLKVLGILSFFNSVDIRSQLDVPILAAFGVGPEEFYSTAEQLEDLEIVEIYDRSVVKITEQIFSTYMFYQTFIDKGLLNFRTLLEDYLEKNQFRFKDTLLPVITVFGPQKVIEKHKPMLLEVLDGLRPQPNLAYDFLELFGFYMPEQLLVFVYQQITTNLEPGQQIDVEPIWENERFSGKSRLLNLLDPFFLQDTPDFTTALALGFRFVAKRPDHLDNYIDQLKRNLHPAGDEVAQNFPRLSKLLSWLNDPGNSSPEASKIFYQVLPRCFLNTHYEHHFYLQSGTGYQLAPNFAWMRTMLWEKIIHKYQDDREQVDLILRAYIKDEPHLNQVLFKFDEPYINRFITEHMRPALFADCYFVQDYLRLVEKKIGRLTELYKPLKKQFNNRSYQIYRLLSYDHYRDHYDYMKIAQARRETIGKKLPVRSLSGFKKLYDHIAEIAGHSGDVRNVISEGLAIILAGALERDLETGLSALAFYLKMGNPCWINPNPVFRQLMQSYPAETARLYALISQPEFAYRQNWLENFFYCLPEELVTREWSEKLLSCYEQVASSNNGIYPDHFIRYENEREDTIYDLLKTLFDKREADNQFLYKLSHDLMRQFPALVEKHLKFCQDLYLQQEEVDPHADIYSEELFLLLDHDIRFFDTYIDHLTSRQERMLSCGNKTLSQIWRYGNAKEMVYRAIVKMRQMRYWSTLNHLSSIFFIQVSEEDLPKCIEVLDQLLNDHKDDIRMLNIILDITRNSLGEQFHPFVKKIMIANPDMEVFKKLEFHNNHFSSTGNQIWADFKAAALSKLHAYIKAELPNHYDYLEHLDLLTRRIAMFKESADGERRLQFRGYR
ncbi:hypothetical protein SAMN05216464_105307 [Mucilaginibacter pineti]|uniref:Uncharacterized protein n=1 Tax=Mucilaginibacter pineti TaxID=1391627 RepID=A0A1G7C6L7_9SPHI|nr:hypothetical protein [Mucilaginibacter pineti]SDE34937.1 hypothetical protein SAMN05216464_105307 [Mucilaginibacter pineti]